MDEGEWADKGDQEQKTPAGHGSSLWASITGVASNLTISVSKAWSSNIATYSGEGLSFICSPSHPPAPHRVRRIHIVLKFARSTEIDTPVSGESRLTRAMKAYHIDKARDPADLPDWLFDERERGVRSYQTSSGAPEKRAPSAGASRPAGLARANTTAYREEPEHQPLPPARITRGPTLADRKAETASRHASTVSGAGSEAHVTKSISRLRELRDAKRNAKVRFGDEAEDAREAPAPAPYAAPYAAPPVPVVERRAPLTLTSTGPAQSQSQSQRFPTPATPRGSMPAPLGASLGVRGRQPSMRVGLPSGVRPVRV